MTGISRVQGALSLAVTTHEEGFMGKDKGGLTPGKALGFRTQEQLRDAGVSAEEAAEVADAVATVADAITGDDEKQ